MEVRCYSFCGFIISEMHVRCVRSTRHFFAVPLCCNIESAMMYIRMTVCVYVRMSMLHKAFLPLVDRCDLCGRSERRNH